MKYFIFSFLLFFQSTCFAYKYDLSVCAIFQDEAPYLKEWIDYHLKVGVEYFYLYNNNSTDEYKEVLKPYIKAKIVKLIDWPSDNNEWNNFCFNIQPGAYRHCINHVKGVTKWLAIIDTDEFLVPKIGNSIVDILESKFHYCSGVCVSWQCFGTSHVQKFPDGQMLKNLTWKAKWDDPVNKQIKSIVKPLDVKDCLNPHFCEYHDRHWHVNTHEERIIDNCPIYLDVMQINHYWTRDEWYLINKKIPRYQRFSSNNNVQGMLEWASRMNSEQDLCIFNQL